jgi:hypothetical protein
MIKTFRGLLTDQDQNRIRLSTKKGKIGYKIINFQIMPKEPGSTSYENVVKIFKVTQSSITGAVDFSDGNLLAAAYIEGNASNQYPDAIQVIFEQEIFNQDIYITNYDVDTGAPVNYYLELETMPLTDNAAAVSTLRDIRLNPQVGG